MEEKRDCNQATKMKPAGFYNKEQRSTSTHTKDNEKAVSTKLKQKAMVKNVQTSPKFMVGGKTLILAERSTTQKRVQALKPLLPPPIVKDLCFGKGFIPNSFFKKCCCLMSLPSSQLLSDDNRSHIHFPVKLRTSCFRSE
ncbi:Hypothetical predicted protein [Podarcis lilfordi]|uniref:Uncharacterized protein n=1 Tax=Podarcis lilfordi TaxID=74358 RepID=A0AA35JPX7_9SAUR|nr:Hypothetical predicted protein [Podarcis lilfordi]